MTGQELTDKLIVGLQKTILAMGRAKSFSELKLDIESYVLNPTNALKQSKEENIITIVCGISLPSLLSDFACFINYFEKVVEIETDKKVDFDIYLKQIIDNKEKVTNTFQEIKNNQNLFATNGDVKQSLFSFIVQKFNFINEEFQRIDDCYRVLLAKQ